jgi:hypothetical protein
MFPPDEAQQRLPMAAERGLLPMERLEPQK